ncbi:ROK family protein [Gleimia sp. 6138-11-ORH1]|uniref:ROK family protein n=1 Tax=Gleimia sp. 6138-11-ORH1 TaxID=2973937 RepID=UPI00216884DC|nr:ROK family protein [Gleimia sp. 6138-11-ORH1]MCS4484303.1 ROK family protein [Gleimia sp. 6138-11-ORH1]
MSPAVKPELLQAAYRLIQTGEATSRAEIKRILDISASTASNLTRALLEENLITVVGTSASTGGRRAAQFKVVEPRAVIALGELGSKHALLAITDWAGHIVSTKEIPLEISDGPETVLSQIATTWEAMLNSSNLNVKKFTACALALPGPVNPQTQSIISPARMPNWNNAPVAEMLSKELNCPAYIDNDARAAALGEVGATEKNYQNFIYVKTGSGIGASYVIDGKPYTGGNGLGGDITHTFSFPSTNLTCACGRVGCLETIASGYSIRRFLASQGVSLPNMQALVQTAELADPQVTSAIRNAGTRLGEALAPLVNFLNPQAVILGGSLSEVGLFKAAVRAALYSACLSMISEELEVELSTHRQYSALIGLDKAIRNQLLPVPGNSLPHQNTPLITTN